jgi:hypothetical protein
MCWSRQEIIVLKKIQQLIVIGLENKVYKLKSFYMVWPKHLIFGMKKSTHT